MLSSDEFKRYARHLVLPEVGKEGQEKLRRASVLIVGIGGLGSPVAMYLAAAGVGTIGLIDSDVVDLANLQRQVIHSTDAVGKPKTQSAVERLRSINPFVQLEAFQSQLTSINAMEIFKEFDIVADATDNFPSRYLISDACVLLGKPDVYGSVFRFEGQVSVFSAKEGPCYRCLHPTPPPAGMVPSCEEAGVLGVVPGIVGMIQATEVVKLLLGVGEPLIGRLLMIETLLMQFSELKLRKNPECPACGERPTIRKLIDYEAFCSVGSGQRGADNEAVPQISVVELKRKLDAGETPFILDVRERYEYELVNLKGVLIPLRDLPRRLDELDASREIVVHCHHGIRSAIAVQYLRGMGFRKAMNLVGGIDQWSKQIDPRLPRY